MNDAMEDWARIERRFNEMDREVRGYYLGLMDTIFFAHPQDQEVSEHRLPFLQKYPRGTGRVEFSMLPDHDVNIEDMYAVFDVMNQDGYIWWVRPFVNQGELWVRIATTENGPGLPEDWESLPNWNHDEWQEVVNQWVTS